MKKEIIIFLSIVIGAGIGGLLSIQFQLPFNLNLLFALVGGVVGYFIYEYEAVIKAIPDAYTKTLETLGGIDYIKKARVVGGVLVGGMYFIPFSIWLFFFSDGKYGHAVFISFIPLVATFVVNELSLIIFFTKNKDLPEIAFIKNLGIFKILNKSNDGWLPFFLVNLFSPFIAMYFLLASFVFIFLGALKFIKNNAKFVFVFIAKLFKAIHSQERILVGTYAVVGGLIAYYFGSIILGMILGGVLGVITYRLITLRIYKTKTKEI